MKGTNISDIFEDEKDFLFYHAPGRINIIGEHTDYNKGVVLPATIDRCIRVGMKKNNAGVLRAYSTEYPGLIVQEYPLVPIKREDGWVKYLKAILFILQQELDFTDYPGLDVYVTSDIPVGAGLSSSAALEVAFLFALNEIFSLKINPRNMAELAQKAENDFIGVKCGIMDQFVSIMGKKNHALFLNVQNMDYQYIYLPLSNYTFILIDTTVSRSLEKSDYNIRRSECLTGLEILKEFLNPQLKSLGEVELKDLLQLRNKFPPTIFKRIIFIVEENLRVKRMVRALQNKSFNQVGQLLYSSHNGLKYFYEVSCPELDFIVDYLGASEGVLGARMMGAGFGGCVLALIKKEKVNKIFSAIKGEYELVFNKLPRFLSVQITDGLLEKKISHI